MMMAQNNQAKAIDNSLVPTLDEAGRMYEENGGHLTLYDEFGRDPLAGREDFITIRMEMFSVQCPSFDNIFHATVNNNKKYN